MTKRYPNLVPGTKPEEDRREQQRAQREKQISDHQQSQAHTSGVSDSVADQLFDEPPRAILEFYEHVKSMDYEALAQLSCFMDLQSSHQLLSSSARSAWHVQRYAEVQAALFDFAGRCTLSDCETSIKHVHGIQPGAPLEVKDFGGLHIYPELFTPILPELMEHFLLPNSGRMSEGSAEEPQLAITDNLTDLEKAVQSVTRGDIPFLSDAQQQALALEQQSRKRQFLARLNERPQKPLSNGGDVSGSDSAPNKWPYGSRSWVSLSNAPELQHPSEAFEKAHASHDFDALDHAHSPDSCHDNFIQEVPGPVKTLINDVLEFVPTSTKVHVSTADHLAGLKPWKRALDTACHLSMGVDSLVVVGAEVSTHAEMSGPAKADHDDSDRESPQSAVGTEGFDEGWRLGQPENVRLAVLHLRAGDVLLCTGENVRAWYGVAHVSARSSIAPGLLSPWPSPSSKIVNGKLRKVDAKLQILKPSTSGRRFDVEMV